MAAPIYSSDTVLCHVFQKKPYTGIITGGNKIMKPVTDKSGYDLGAFPRIVLFISGIGLVLESARIIDPNILACIVKDPPILYYDPLYYCVALFFCGFALIAFSMNGRRLISVSRNGLLLASPPSEEQVANDDNKAQEVPVTDNDQPESPTVSANPEATYGKDGVEYQVYSPKDIPARVLFDAISSIANIKTLGDIQYAFRRQGKGNHRWVIKLINGDCWSIAYGGKGKKESSTGPVGNVEQ